MTNQPKLDFVIFYVADIEAAHAYFTEKLGFSYEPEQSSPTFRFLRGGTIDFAVMQGSAETVAPGKVEVYFKTDDLPGLRAELVERGVVASPIMHPPFGAIFNVPAPDDHHVVMMGA